MQVEAIGAIELDLAAHGLFAILAAIDQLLAEVQLRRQGPQAALQRGRGRQGRQRRDQAWLLLSRGEGKAKQTQRRDHHLPTR